MRGIPSLAKPLMQQRGPIGKILTTAVLAGGAGVVANVVDKQFLNSRLKGMDVPLPAQLTTMLKGSTGSVTPTLNMTDAAMLLVANGLKVPSGKSIITMVGLLLAKKLAEARSWIVDDPIATSIPNKRSGPGAKQLPTNTNTATTYAPVPVSGGW